MILVDVLSHDSEDSLFDFGVDLLIDKIATEVDLTEGEDKLKSFNKAKKLIREIKALNEFNWKHEELENKINKEIDNLLEEDEIDTIYEIENE